MSHLAGCSPEPSPCGHHVSGLATLFASYETPPCRTVDTLAALPTPEGAGFPDGSG